MTTETVQQKQGKFYLVINTTKYGERKPTWISTNLPVKGNKKRAELLLQEALADYDQSLGVISEDISFSRAIKFWLETVSIKVDKITLQGYETLAYRHIIPYFDELDIKLTEVTRLTLQCYLNQKYRFGRLDGKGGLSPASIRHHKNILYQTLEEAVRNGLIETNPCKFVSLPKTQRHEGKFYSANQLSTLFDTIKDERLFPLVYVTSLYGLRRSELLGLQWDSIDFERQTLTIRHTVCKVVTTVSKDKTKNTSSYRSFPLTDDIRDILEKAKQQELYNQNIYGASYQQNNYIFKWEDGRPYSPDYVSHAFKKLLAKYEFPHIRFHELRIVVQAF